MTCLFSAKHASQVQTFTDNTIFSPNNNNNNEQKKIQILHMLQEPPLDEIHFTGKCHGRLKSTVYPLLGRKACRKCVI